MKHITRLLALAAICAAPLLALRAAPLATSTPVYAAPDFTAPVLVTLAAGAEPNPSTAASAVALPEGWQAIAITASQEVWVRDNDLNKELDVKPGAILRVAPAPDAAEAGTMAAGDETELRGIQGKWVQMNITKKTTGYINATASAPAALASNPPQTNPEPLSTTAQPAPSVPETTTANYAYTQAGSVPYAPNQTAAPAQQQPLSVSQQSGGPLPADVRVQQPGAYNNTTTTANYGASAAPAPARTTTSYSAPAANVYASTNVSTSAPSAAATMVVTEQNTPATVGAGRTYEARPATEVTTTVPRVFEGTFASTKRPLMPRRPYDYQLTAPDGTRLVYLDLSKLSATEVFDTYLGRTVIINGSMAAVPNTTDIVVRVETLQAR